MSNSSISGLHLVCVLSLFAAACDSSSNSGDAATEATGIVDGQQKTVIVDPNQAGSGSTLRIEAVTAGRLVDIYDSEDRDGDPTTPEIRTLQFRDFVIGEQVAGDGTNFLLTTNPITQRAEFTILADADGDYVGPLDAITQREKFKLLFGGVSESAGQLAPTSTSPTSLPPFPLVPRNAAISVRFSDLLDPTTINSGTVRLAVGNPPIAPFDGRVFPDPNHGAFLNGVFRPTRVIIDTTVTEIESNGGTLPLNAAGLPPSQSTTAVNAAVRVPSVLNAATGQFQLLRNLAGKTVSKNNDPLSENNFTLDIVRAFRTGSPNDPHNGFLRDDEPPVVRGVQPVSISGLPQPVLPDPTLGEIAAGPSPDRVFLASIDFSTNACAVTPNVGDLLVLTGTDIPEVFLDVTHLASPPQGGTATDVRLRLLRFPESETYDDIETQFLAASSGRFESTFRTGTAINAACFIEISPPAATPPTTSVVTRPRISVRFSEPIDPDSILPFDNMRLDRVTTDPPPPDKIVVAEITPSPDLREFRYLPTLNLDHAQGTPSGDVYFFNLVGGIDGATDLAGNPLVATLPADIPITVNSSLPNTLTGGIVLRFSRVNEFGFGTLAAPQSEVRGQFERDLAAGFITGRTVTRQSQVIDKTTTATFNWFDAIAGAITIPSVHQTPLHPFGSRMMTLWRYCDVGFGLLDETTANIDVEGLNWSPLGTQISSDFFPLFEMSLSHSSRLPDDALNTLTNLPAVPSSGLLPKYDDNVLVDPDNVKKVVHPRNRGYQLDPQKAFSTATGVLMLPYPMNRGVPATQFQYYTWRDTAILGKGGADGNGAEILGYLQASLIGLPGSACITAANVLTPTSKNPLPTPRIIYPAGAVRTLGLPLLMEFKCFPSSTSVGLNSPSEANMFGPIFRVYSTGGHDGSNQPVFKNPDAELTGSGTFNGDPTNLTPGGLPIPLGTPFPGSDNAAYAGQLDLVLRVTRVHTRWFDSGTSVPAFPDYTDPILEPRPDQQPTGTSVTLAFRGTSSVSGTNFVNGGLYDEYGDPYVARVIVTDDLGTCTNPDDDLPPTSQTLNGGFAPGADLTTWKKDIDEIDGFRWFQVRITFVSNTSTFLRPKLSSLALPFRRG